MLDDADVAGYSLLFTTGRGNDVACAAVRALESYVVGRDVADLVADVGALARELIWDGQLRWLGPEKGVMHMAIGAVVNAAWDLRCRLDGQPLWRLLASLSPQEIVDQVDFTYIDDALTASEALDLLEAKAAGRDERIAALEADGLPAYTTSAGWLGYDDDKVARLTRQSVEDGFTMLKMKVGADVESDIRRLGIARHAAGERARIAVDANQRWGVGQAIEWMAELAQFDPYWIEEPTSPDDVLGHLAIRRAVHPVRVATGEHVQNRVIFKQLLQAEAIDVVQIDACRVGGVNENLAILLLAAKFGVPVCPHAGGVGLCEMVQHLAMFDFIAVSGTTDDRWIEYVDHLHEHFTDPVVVRGGRYLAPTGPGGGARLLDDSVAEYRFPDGPAWTSTAMSADDFAGLRVLVTGGASGIGHAVAAAALRRGATVAVLDLDPAGAPAGAVAIRADVTDDASVAAAVEQAATTMGGIDVLVNNAGIGAQGTIEANSLDEWRHVFDVNVLGIVRVMRSALAHLRRSPGRRSRQHVLDRGDRRPSRAGRVQRVQGRRAVADDGDGRRPRRRRHPGQLREPGNRRHAVGRPPARPGRRSRRRADCPGGPSTDGTSGDRRRGRRGRAVSRRTRCWFDDRHGARRRRWDVGAPPPPRSHRPLRRQQEDSDLNHELNF